jgi:RNA polymerase primary sigma factor
MRQLKITSQITQRDSLSLDKYLVEIGKIDLINVDEEARLARQIRMGNEQALHQLTRSNLRFVISVAKQYQHQGLALSDLINEGNLGLIKAAQRFDETKGFKFISYAVWWIRQSILQAIVENARLVRLPLNKISLHNKVNQAYLDFMQAHEREPSADEIADKLNLKLKSVEQIVRMGNPHVSMDAPMGSEEDSDSLTLLDTLTCAEKDTPELGLMNESLQKEVQIGLSGLHPREREILSAYFGLNGQAQMNLEEISEQCNLTRERVRQIKERALRRLRKTVSQSELHTYLG